MNPFLTALKAQTIAAALRWFADHPSENFVRLADLPGPSSWQGRALAQTPDEELAAHRLMYSRRGWNGFRHLDRPHQATARAMRRRR